LPTDHKYIKNKDFVGIVERDIAPQRFLGDELYDMVLEYGDIVFGFQSDKQKFFYFGLPIIGLSEVFFVSFLIGRSISSVITLMLCV
jgi:hypothetical protein